MIVLYIATWFKVNRFSVLHFQVYKCFQMTDTTITIAINLMIQNLDFNQITLIFLFSLTFLMAFHVIGPLYCIIKIENILPG